MTTPLRLGIVGAGAVTQVAHLPVLRKVKEVEVVGLCDADLPKARALATRFGVHNAFDDIEELLGAETLDALLIATPNHLHESHVLAALSAGLHVMVERPVATTLAGAQRVVKAAQKQERIVMAGMNHRYRSDVQTVRGFVQSGELGEIDSVRGTWHVFRPARAQLGWRQRRAESGGGAMLDLGLSVLDLGLWLAGNPRPVRVSATLDRSGERGVEHAGSAFVVCEGGASVYVDVTWRHIGEGEFFGVGLRGTRGAASINPLRVWKELNGVPVDVSPTGASSRESPFTTSVRAEWAHFVAAVNGAAKVPDLREHLTLHQVLDAIYQSADEGREIAL